MQADNSEIHPPQRHRPGRERFRGAPVERSGLHPDGGRPLGHAHGVLLSRAGVCALELFDIDATAGGRRLPTYDQRGHGRSTGRPHAEDYRFENFGRDLLDVLDTVDVHEPMDFVGSPSGCAVTLHAALAAPQRFRPLVLMIPPVAWAKGPRKAREWYTDAADTIESEGPTVWLRDILPDATLHVSTSVADIETWTDRTAEFPAD